MIATVSSRYDSLTKNGYQIKTNVKDKSELHQGKDVNPKNFLNILKGNASGVIGGNGKLIDSSSDDRIFVYFTDHGATGLISFPDDIVRILTVKMLDDTLSWMYTNGRYKQLVFYLEACESGSMFDVVRDNINGMLFN
uniref:Legumain n=1 Tax=Heterorhabditis bacteriophora TaxID=37862 RepID=A0A1I7XGP9_HETBA